VSVCLWLFLRPAQCGQSDGVSPLHLHVRVSQSPRQYNDCESNQWGDDPWVIGLTHARCTHTGCRSTSKWPHSYTSRSLAFHHRTWPTTAVLSPMLVRGDCVPQRAEHAQWRGHTAPLATERLELPARTMEQSSVAPEGRYISYSEFRRSLKTFLFGQWGHGAVWTVLTVPTRNILTYLLTYLLTRSIIMAVFHITLHIYLW